MGTMQRMRRASRIHGAWPQRGSVVPQWFFWTVLITVALGCGLAIGYLGNPIDAAPATLEAAGRDEGRTSDAEQPPAVVATPSEAEEEASAPSESEDIVEQPAGSELIIDGVTVQVLNASGRRKGDNRVVNRLRDLGFQIVAVNPAAKIYKKTTVFWSKPSGRDAARSLAGNFEWKSAPRPRNLSKSVSTHVVVGRDEL